MQLHVCQATCGVTTSKWTVASWPQNAHMQRVQHATEMMVVDLQGRCNCCCCCCWILLYIHMYVFIFADVQPVALLHASFVLLLHASLVSWLFGRMFDCLNDWTCELCNQNIFFTYAVTVLLLTCVQQRKNKMIEILPTCKKCIYTCNTRNYICVCQQTRCCLPHIATLQLPHWLPALVACTFYWSSLLPACSEDYNHILPRRCATFHNCPACVRLHRSVLRLNAAEILIKLKINIAVVSVVVRLHRYLSIHSCVIMLQVRCSVC